MSQQQAAKSQKCQCVHIALPEPSLIVYTKYSMRMKTRTKTQTSSHYVLGTNERGKKMLITFAHVRHSITITVANQKPACTVRMCIVVGET